MSVVKHSGLKITPLSGLYSSVFVVYTYSDDLLAFRHISVAEFGHVLFQVYKVELLSIRTPLK